MSILRRRLWAAESGGLRAGGKPGHHRFTKAQLADILSLIGAAADAGAAAPPLPESVTGSRWWR